MQQRAARGLPIHGEHLLPTAKTLNEKLGRLYVAQRTHEEVRTRKENDFEAAYQAAVIENEIRDLAPLGLYEGYPGDDLVFGFVRLLSVRRANEGANIHTFKVKLAVLVDEVNFQPLELDLIDFLGDIYRPICGEGHHRGPRFWHFD